VLATSSRAYDQSFHHALVIFFVLDWRWPGEEKEPIMLCAPDA